MITVSQIISEVQNEVNDLAVERVQRAELIDALNNVAMDVAEETRVWTGRYITTPNPLFTVWVINTTYITNQITQSPLDNNYYLCLSNFVSTIDPSLDTTNWSIINYWTVGTSYVVNDLIWYDGPTFYRCILAHTSTTSEIPPNDVYWSVIAGVDIGIYSVKLPYTFNSDLSPFKIIRVTRGIPGLTQADGTVWSECREYSEQAISSTISGNSSFQINRTQLGRQHFLTQFVDNLNQIDDSINLVFGAVFEPNEIITIDYISGRPWGNPGTDSRALTVWMPNDTNPQAFPDFLRNAFKYGLMWRICEGLFFKGDREFGEKAQLAKMRYDEYLAKAVSHARMLRDVHYSIKQQPLNWLEE